MESSEPKDTWRVFIAIDLPLNLRQRLVDHVKRVRERVPDAQASWTRSENIHLTLKFLADTPSHIVPKLSEATARAVAGLEPFELRVGETGVFPSHSTPRVLWIGLRDSEGKLSQLHSRLEEECMLVGFEKEARPFHPHLTVARLRRSQHARELASAHKQIKFEPVDLFVREVMVIRSEISSAGSRYTTISRHHFGDGSTPLS